MLVVQFFFACESERTGPRDVPNQSRFEWSLGISGSPYQQCQHFFGKMSELRRRIFGSSRTAQEESSDSSREGSPAPAPKEAGGEAYRIVPKEKLDKLRKGVKAKGNKRRNFWIFGLGSLFGLFLAGYFASSNGGLDKLVTMAGLEDLNLDSVLDVLPAGLIREVRDMQVCLIESWVWAS